MKHRTVIRIGSLAACVTLSAVAALGQDLGSANKLFGAGAKKPAATSKPKMVKKPVTKAPKPLAKAAKPVAKSRPEPVLVKSKVLPKADSKAKQPSTKPTTRKPIPGETTEAVTKFKTFGVPKPSTPVIFIPAKTSAATESRYEELVEQGNEARDDRDYSAAEGAYRSAKEIKPRDARAIYGLGNLYSDQQRWEEAEAAYRAAMKIDSTSAVAHIALSYVLTQPVAAPDLADRYAEAERLGRRAIQLDSRNALAYDQLGVAMELRGLIGPETENAYRKAIGLEASFAPAYAHLGRLLRRRGLTAESTAAYKKAISLATDIPTMILVAEVMQSEQRYADSEPLLRTAIVSDPKNPSALILLGRALTAQGKFTDAEQILRKGAIVSPNAYMPNSLLGSLYWRQGKLDQAETVLMQAVRFVSRLDKRHLATQFQQVGDGYRKAGRSENAARAYRQARILENESKEGLAKLANEQAY